MLFHRLVLVVERETIVEKSLSYEFTQLPMSLFDKYRCMRKPNKAALGTYLKDLLKTIECRSSIHIVIDGGWLLHQL